MNAVVALFFFCALILVGAIALVLKQYLFGGVRSGNSEENSTLNTIWALEFLGVGAILVQLFMDRFTATTRSAEWQSIFYVFVTLAGSLGLVWVGKRLFIDQPSPIRPIEHLANQPQKQEVHALRSMGVTKGERKAVTSMGLLFISYHHGDAAVAMRVRKYLSKRGFKVIIDLDCMMPGQDIKEFIKDSVRRADIIISIVSSDSLLSSWVALETITSLNREEREGRKLFIACTLTDDFLQPEFRLTCTKQINDRMKEIESLLREYAKERLDPVDLSDETSRLFNLRNNLGIVLARLRNSLCLDLRDPAFNDSMKRLTSSVFNKP